MSYQAQNEILAGRQLEAQSIVFTADLPSATSDLPGAVVIDSSTIASTTITLNVGEDLAKFFIAEVRNRATGASATLTSVALDGTAKKVVITLNGTGLSNVCVKIVYKVA
jgi:hypothetical protein